MCRPRWLSMQQGEKRPQRRRRGPSIVSAPCFGPEEAKGSQIPKIWDRNVNKKWPTEILTPNLSPSIHLVKSA